MLTEVVERKGLGHPDTLADLIAEELSCRYSEMCLRRFGAVLHHNVDKLALLGGLVRSGLGFIERVHPIRVLFLGRMSRSFGGEKLNIEELQRAVATEVLKCRVPRIDVADIAFEHLTSAYSRIPRWFAPLSQRDIPDAVDARASDTVCVSGAWPPSPVEQLVLDVEKALYLGGRPRFEHVGQDVKIMAARRDEHVRLTVALPVLSSAVETEHAYNEIIRDFELLFREVAVAAMPSNIAVDVQVNTQSRMGHPTRRLYVLGLGTCLECGEEGLVGRGNKLNGLISVARPNVVECPFGKNPSYHAGKVFGYFSQLLAKKVHGLVAEPVAVTIVAQQGDPIREPSFVSIEVDGEGRLPDAAIRTCIQEILQETDYMGDIVQRKSLMRSLAGFELE